RFEWNFRRNLCQISAKYWHEEKTWTATRYYYWDWAFILPARIQPITATPPGVASCQYGPSQNTAIRPHSLVKIAR
ncbi:hypothetical protein, partial [Thiolapillus sp.]